MTEVIFSTIVLALAVFAAWSAREAMNKGLTYTAMAAIVWTLSILALARLWHTLREFFELDHFMGSFPENFEYIIYIVAYAIFIFLVWKSFSTRMPVKKDK